MARRRKSDVVVVTCYGRQEVLERRDALAKYKEGILCCEGAERDRYVNIYFQLMDGAREASDERLW